MYKTINKEIKILTKNKFLFITISHCKKVSSN